MEKDIQILFNIAKDTINKSYSPYSNFKVSAAILSSNNNTYTGINIENASYPCSLCAEGAAIANMVTNGDYKIAKMLVMVDYNITKEICTPCGLCRQRIREFADDNLPIYLANTKQVLKTTNLGELLYMSFGPNNLKK